MQMKEDELRKPPSSNETLLLEIVVRLPIVDVALVVLQLLHCLLLEDLLLPFPLQFLRH